ncbi:MAG: LysR family transcriptional regulator [Betaproteobacteria bacterium]|nr:LysR family transcriptional regulator [Betaproteobacteria bacterium]MBU6513458.1 LysR family transcriptional regulator [Betaproteobacteria bacterium]MDE1955889.1 LysR family transcriptional regulator [Betaproteobacteria bacterium]MDE2153789.1 LysR family transcriptional regulator [Betaproteobacteria bacterium]MDE2478851.1 LysR family transcriptional regulator [Betaproteobacteria bacterium]
MELRHLRYFLAVAETGHMTRAAEHLGIQQPPLSQQIRALERELSLELFTRHPKGVSLTEAGVQLRVEARRILDGVAALEKRMASVARGHSGLLAVGFTSSAAAHGFTPQVLRACRRDYPDIELQITEHNAAELIESVADGRLHCAFLRVPVTRPQGLRFEVLLSEPVVLALPIDHPLAERYAETEPVPWQALDGQPLILTRRPGAQGLYGEWLELMQRRGLRVRVHAEVSRMMTNINLVASGAGISVVPASMQGAHRYAVTYRRVSEDFGLEAPITLAYREDHDSGVTSTFLALTRRSAQAQRARDAEAAAPAQPRA